MSRWPEADEFLMGGWRREKIGNEKRTGDNGRISVTGKTERQECVKICSFNVDVLSNRKAQNLYFIDKYQKSYRDFYRPQT